MAVTRIYLLSSVLLSLVSLSTVSVAYNHTLLLVGPVLCLLSYFPRRPVIMHFPLGSGTFATDKMWHNFHETEDERLYREFAKFPDYKVKITNPLISRRKTPMIDQLFGCFGTYNPFARPCDAKDHIVWLLDNTAWRPNEKEPWCANFTAAYFIKDTGEDDSRIVATVAGLLNLADDAEAKKTIAERVQPFLDAILPGRYVKISIGEGVKDIRKLSVSDLNGVSHNLIQIVGSFKDGSTITSRVVDIPDSIPSTTTFATSTGWAVISDIDDTIKKTLTSSPLSILSTTFVETPQPISGMPEFYKFLNTKLDSPPFWYISASPYNLYPFLRAFREEHYPVGELVLRETSIMNLAGFLLSLTAGVQAFKVDRIKAVQKMFPGRKMICIGDSTQSDPEAYAQVYHDHPHWVRAIFIRKVTGVAEMDEQRKNSPKRFEDAFKDVPQEVWYVYEDPKELYEKVEKLLEDDIRYAGYVGVGNNKWVSG